MNSFLGEKLYNNADINIAIAWMVWYRFPMSYTINNSGGTLLFKRWLPIAPSPTPIKAKDPARAKIYFMSIKLSKSNPV